MQVTYYSVLSLVSVFVFYQDFKERQVSLWLLLVYSGLIVSDTIYDLGFDNFLQNAISSVIYFSLCFTGVFLYYFLKERSIPAVIDKKIGWADVIICLTIGVSLNISSLIVFFTISFVISAIIGLILQARDKTVPLAGFLVILYLIFICISAFFPIDLMFS